MHGLDPLDDESGVVFRDMIMLALLGFVTIVILIIPHINPVAKPVQREQAPGNVIVEIRWPDQLNTDVDLWVQGPGDRPVGYARQSGRIFNLLRDDLGHRRDASKLNYEISYSRGVMPGEYTVNVHLFSNVARSYPVPVTIVVSIKSSPDEPARQILTSNVKLRHINQEVTVFRFRLSKAGLLVPRSVHSIPRSLARAPAR
jgi:hypothetical protein